MTSTQTRDVPATLAQITELHSAGCDIVRIGIPDRDSLPALPDLIRHSPAPLVADIHFDASLALKALAYGVAGIRINPGNIGDRKKLLDIISLAKERKSVIRIGVNAGSLEKQAAKKYRSRVEAMVESALDWLKFFEDQGFFDIKISLKSSNVIETLDAYRMIDSRCDYPLHLGVTEAGSLLQGTVKSALGIGTLLMEGIGNTIRVSLTDDPIQEVRVAHLILSAIGLRHQGVEIVSCPTCSRTTVDLIGIVRHVEDSLSSFRPSRKIKVAVMGCEVNGPGEAMDADIGLAFSKEKAFIFQKGKMIETLGPNRAVHRFVELIQKM